MEALVCWSRIRKGPTYLRGWRGILSGGNNVWRGIINENVNVIFVELSLYIDDMQYHTNSTHFSKRCLIFQITRYPLLITSSWLNCAWIQVSGFLPTVTFLGNLATMFTLRILAFCSSGKKISLSSTCNNFHYLEVLSDRKCKLKTAKN